MKVVLEKVFPLDASSDSAWQLLQDIEMVAGCMPGAKITERVDATHYKGTITVRLGPATMSFKGDIEVLNLDTAVRSLHLVGKGTDATGSSAASMDLVASVQATGDTCELTGRSEVTMSGKAAALGSRLMGPVADQMLKQFVANFAARLQASATPQVTPVASEAPGSVPQSVMSVAPEAAHVPPSELNGLALAWAVMREWFRGLFARKSV
ncbi:SRPBCC family protein [Caballeronia sp. dw_19]|uniref:SRPBCC family protein n=1 Tax=Caballeronia sp. dw_19 TaxID=2719791 RepID=UPI001BD6013D|nr:SRPBCC family protein [Caballeronia sp. dw_19]